MESFMAGVSVWEALLWPDPGDRKKGAKLYTACVMLQQLYEVMTSQPRRSMAQVSAIVKMIAALRPG